MLYSALLRSKLAYDSVIPLHQMTPTGWSASSEVFGFLLPSSPCTHIYIHIYIYIYIYIYSNNTAELLIYHSLRDGWYHLGLDMIVLGNAMESSVQMSAIRQKSSCSCYVTVSLSYNFHADMLGETQTLIVYGMDCCGPFPLTARSKAWVCRSSLAVIAGSNPDGGMDVCRECCMLSGRDVCVRLITCREEL